MPRRAQLLAKKKDERGAWRLEDLISLSEINVEEALCALTTTGENHAVAGWGVVPRQAHLLPKKEDELGAWCLEDLISLLEIYVEETRSALKNTG